MELVWLNDKVVGRFGMPDWTAGTMMAGAKLNPAKLSPYKFTASFFTELARRAPAEEDVRKDDALESLGYDFSKLSADALDQLAADYLLATKGSLDPHGFLFIGAGSEQLHGVIIHILKHQEETLKPLLSRIFSTFNKSPFDSIIAESQRKLSGDILRVDFLGNRLSSTLASMRGEPTALAIEHTLEPPPHFTLPPSPIHETNDRLEKLGLLMEQQLEAAQQQRELTQAIQKLTLGVLESAAESGEEARKATKLAATSVWLTFGAILVAILIGAASIYDNERLSHSSDASTPVSAHADPLPIQQPTKKPDQNPVKK